MTSSKRWLPGIVPPFLFVLAIFAGACDFQILESPEVPRWGISLTIPLVDTTYSFAGIVDSQTIFQDPATKDLQIEFSGELDTTSIDSSFLEIALPSEATPSPISESVTAPVAADFFTPMAETVLVAIKLSDLLSDAGVLVSLPSLFDVPISKELWDNMAGSPVDQVEGPYQIIDTTAMLASNNFIKRFRYVELDGTPLSSSFYTNVISDSFPTVIDTVSLALSATPLSVVHETIALATNTNDAQTTDLASEKLGSSMSVGIHVALPPAGAGGVIIKAGTDPGITLEMILEIGGVDSLGITTARTSLIPTPPDPLPLPGDIEINSGVLRTGVPPSVNEISYDLTTGTGPVPPFDILFQVTFPNFSSTPAGTDSLILGPDTLSATNPVVSRTASIEGYTFHNPGGSGPLSAFEYELVAEILEKDVVLPLDGSSLGELQTTFSMGDLYFESIDGNFHIEFPTVPTTIENIPTGFAGFQFGRLALRLLLKNEIDLPVRLDLALTGKTFEGDSITVVIDAPINYPSAPSAPAGNGDTATTLIVLDENAVSTYWLTEGETTISAAWDSTIVTSGSGGTIVDVMNLPPDIILVGGNAVIQGQGVVEAGKGVWGTFDLKAPFAFVLPEEIRILPVNLLTLPPLAPATRENIKTALLSASLTSRVVTNFPFGGNISMLVSDSNLFTISFDKLDAIAAGFPDTVVKQDTTIVYNTVQEALAADSIFSIDHVVYYPETVVAGSPTSPQATTARKVEFFANATDTVPTFWIGRMFQMELPLPQSVDSNGYVVTPGDSTMVVNLDKEQVGWIAGDSTLYMKPYITFYATPGIRSVQTTNTIGFTSYITFDMSSDILIEEEPLDTIIVATAPDDTTVYVDSTLVIDLGDVFSHNTLSITDKNLDISATSGHPGVVAVGRIYTAGTTRNLELTGVGSGTAKITLTANDNETTPVLTSFYVTVIEVAPSPGPSSGPFPDGGRFSKGRSR